MLTADAGLQLSPDTGCFLGEVTLIASSVFSQAAAMGVHLAPLTSVSQNSSTQTGHVVSMVLVQMARSSPSSGHMDQEMVGRTLENHSPVYSNGL